MRSETESADSKAVDRAAGLLQSGSGEEAKRILQDVCSRCPQHYEHEYVEGNTRYVTFWDMDEFMEYAATRPKDSAELVLWIRSAYPRACYYLGYLLIDHGEFQEAIEWLDKGRAMEPQNPRFLLESGMAYGRMKDHQRSLDCYLQVLDLPSVPAKQRAVALRQIGVQLIDLGRLDEAERRLRESLDLEPGNANAEKELTYIRQLLSLGATS